MDTAESIFIVLVIWTVATAFVCMAWGLHTGLTILARELRRKSR